MDVLICFSNAFNVRIIIDVCVRAPLNYLTSERNGAIEMQDNNYNNSFAEGVRANLLVMPSQTKRSRMISSVVIFSCAQLFAVAHRSVT